jgi:hypothetical protein
MPIRSRTRIAESVAVLGVDRGEVIDVDQNHREGTFEPFGSADFLFEGRDQDGARVQCGQRIVQRGLIRLTRDALRNGGNDIKRCPPHHLGQAGPPLRRRTE